MEPVKVLKTTVRKLFWVSFLTLATTTIAFSQAGNGGISGIVTDSSGAVVPGATVTVKSNATGVSLSHPTTGAGVYSFTALPPSTYEVTVTQTGFNTAVHSNVLVSVDQVMALNVVLKLGAVSQTVTVAGTTALAGTSNSTVGQLIDAATINRVPLLTRDVYQLVQLSAGVSATNGVPNASDTSAVFNARPGADVAAYTINGAPPGNLQFLLDGSPINIAENNLGANIPAMQVPLDDVQEYRVETQNTPANFQSGGAGAISLVTKSGTNHFHGDAFAYFRPNALAANDYFLKASQLSSNQPNQPQNFHRYQEGGSISGPILHNKLFFFGDYEATQQELAQTGTYTVPTAAERTGNFSADPLTVYDPMVPDQPSGERQPFAGNIVPQQYLNPISLKLAQQFPLPNQAGIGPYHVNNYFASGLDPNDAQKFDIRVDGYHGQKQHLFGRFSFARLKFGNADLYGAANIFDPYYYQNITNARNILLADDYSVTPNTLLQFRYSFTRHYENQTGDPRQLGFDTTALGFPAEIAKQSVYHTIPYITFGTTAGLGAQSYVVFQFASEISDAIASASGTKGKHQWNAGVEFQERFMNEGQPIAPSGQYSFDTTATDSRTYAGDGNEFASFIIGMGSAPGNEGGNFTYDIFGAQSNPYYAAYIQDNYKATHNLTIDIGLRWDIFGGRNERHNRLEYFDPGIAYNVNGVPLTGGEQFVGVNGNGRSPFTTNMLDFGPRASFAWQPAQHLVVHGGGGIYYGPSSEMVANGALGSDGFSASTNWNATTYNADGNTVMLNSLSNPFPNGFVQPTKSSLGPATNLGNELGTSLHTQRTPTTYDFNIGTENELPHGIILSLAYVGSRGHFLPLAGADQNQLPLSTIGQYKASLYDPVPNEWEAAYPSTSAFYQSPTVPRFISLEEYPQFTCGGINCGVEMYGYPAGDSRYNSLQTKVEKRLTSHFTTLATFTWGKLLTDDFAPPLSFVGYLGGSVQDWKDLKNEDSVSQQDISHDFTWLTSYDLPIGSGRRVDLNGWKNQAFGGWTLSTIVYLSSGVPIGSPSGTGNKYFNQRVDQVCDPSAGAKHTAAQWFNYTCFAEPASKFVAGTSPAFQGNVRTNGAHNLDASIFKNFTMGGQRSLRLEVSTYNATNSVQYGYPNVFWNPNPTAVNMSGFGQITSAANTPRQFQFASKFVF